MEQCQQAIECILKAYLNHHEVKFAGTHDIEVLSKLIEKIDFDFSTELEPLYFLTDFSGTNRYKIKLGQLIPCS
ncbi:HEPN domain-containing protein [Bdellovibrio bacteriovorus]|uniref:HEPN domain-containing protein n=1 Tax=Bdellovibrio bacteriovorus TaxID=959 RepID=UPI0005A11AD3